jgi:hypothetical protein
MTWVKLDDGFFRNRKARMAGKDGRALFLAGLCYCAGTLTDGYIDANDLPIIAAEAGVRASLSGSLVDVGLWKTTEGGWTVNDYHLYNRPAASIRRERDEGRERAARSRERRANDKRTDRAGSPDPSSSSPLGLGLSSSSSSVVPAAEPEDDDDWASIIARRRLADRVRDLGRVHSPKRWLKATAKDVHDEHDPLAGRLVEQHPDWSQTQLADALENGGTLRSVPVPTCDACHNGWIEDVRGDAVACPKCRAAS